MRKGKPLPSVSRARALIKAEAWREIVTKLLGEATACPAVGEDTPFVKDLPRPERQQAVQSQQSPLKDPITKAVEKVVLKAESKEPLPLGPIKVKGSDRHSDRVEAGEDGHDAGKGKGHHRWKGDPDRKAMAGPPLEHAEVKDGIPAVWPSRHAAEALQADGDNEATAAAPQKALAWWWEGLGGNPPFPPEFRYKRVLSAMGGYNNGRI